MVVVSDDSKIFKADLPSGKIDNLFRKPQRSGKAEKKKFAATLLTNLIIPPIANDNAGYREYDSKLDIEWMIVQFRYFRHCRIKLNERLH